MNKSLQQQYIIKDYILHHNDQFEAQKLSLNPLITGIWIIFGCVLFSENALSQNFILGSPQIINHTKEEYQAGRQNWDILSDNGRLYFANNGGLLTYDGMQWSTFATPNNTIMRSIERGLHNKVYVSAQNEIGYFLPTSNGSLQYIDLKDSIHSETMNISEIWNLDVVNDSLFFTSNRHVNLYYKSKIQRFGHDSHVECMAHVQNSIWYQCLDLGIYKIKDGKDVFIKNSDIFIGKIIIHIFEGKDRQIFIVTAKNGIFKLEGTDFVPWKTNADDYLSDKQATSAIFDDSYGLFIGTHLGGVLQINESGLVTSLLTKREGLQTNSITCLDITSNGILWLGTSNGIDEINIATSYERFFPDNELEGAVYDMDRWNETLYFSTENGLYQIAEKDYYNPLQEKQFSLVEGTNGQNWGTDVINGQLLCAHHEGPKWVTQNNTTEVIAGANSAWKFLSLNENHVALGTYEGLCLYQINPDNSISFKRKILNFEESSRILMLDDLNNLWVSHPYKYVYRINFNENYSSEEIKTYSKENGFVSDDRNYVFNINGQCYLTNPTGVYIYNSNQDKFDKDVNLSELFGDGNHVRRLIQIENKIWAITDEFTVQIEQDDKSSQWRIVQKLKIGTPENYIGGFEELFPFKENKLILSSIEGGIEYNLRHTSSQVSNLQVKQINLTQQNDSLIYGGYGLLKEFTLDPKENAIRFVFYQSHGYAEGSFQFSTRLLGLDDNWTAWSYATNKEYTNLSHGDYQFEVRALDHEENLIYSAPVKFNILKAWYQTWLAYLLYFLLIFGALLALLLIPQKKYKLNTAQLEEEKRIAENEKRSAELEKQKAEEEKISAEVEKQKAEDEKRNAEEAVEKIRQEKLEDEIRFKNNELASSTLHLLQKNQTLNTLREKIADLKRNAKDAVIKKELNKILSMIRSDLRLDEDWGKFSLHFDEVHNNFIKNLKAQYPALTTNDHKLCAYLKMNLTTKEIAPLLNISVRGVEIGRYRLRKKLNLERTVNLNEFLNSGF